MAQGVVARAGAAWLWALLAGCGGAGETSEPPLVQPQAHVAGLRCTGADSSGWCWQAPQPHGHGVNDVAFTSVQDGWAVGDGGLVRRTRDGGVTWEEHFLPGATLLQAVRFAPDGRQGWVLGADGGRLWRSGDGGDTWTAASVPLDFAARLDLADNGALVVHGDVGGRSWASQVRISSDGGNTWRDPGPLLLAIDADGTQWNWLDLGASGGGDIRMSTDGGQTFQRPAAWPAGRQAWRWETYGGGYAWVNFYPTDDNTDTAPMVRLGNGQPWLPLTLPDSGYGSQWFDSLGRWSSGNQSLWHADAAGGAWTAVTPPYADYNSWGYTFVDGRTAWTREQMPSQAAWVTADGGASWVRSLPFGEGATYPTQLLRDGGGGLLLAGNGLNDDGDTKPAAWLRSMDQGRSWTALVGARDPAQGSMAALWMLDGQRGLALTHPGRLLRTADGGRHWQLSATRLEPGDATAASASMQFLPDGTGWVFNSGKLYRSDDAGRSWAAMGLELPGYTPASLHVMDDGTAVVRAYQWCFAGHTGTRCNHRIFISTDRAATWQATDPAWPANGLQVSLDSQRLASAGESFSTDGGQTWQASHVPAGLDIGERVRVVRGAGALWLLAHHGLLRSTDGGASWVSVELPLPPGYVVSWPMVGPGLRDMAFADARQGWIVGARGLVLATTDGGATWQRQASGTSTDFTSVFALGPKAVWVAGGQASILASATGGR